MRKILLGTLAALTLAGPVLADNRYDRHEDRHEWRHENNWEHRGADWRWDAARYRGPAYVHPPGYAYRPWGVGYRLPPAYVGGSYWIGNPGYYRLPPAYYGTRWVRVGPDALLVRLGDGVVIRAVRGLYW